jgi:hypothetical protein
MISRKVLFVLGANLAERSTLLIRLVMAGPVDMVGVQCLPILHCEAQV